MKIETKRLILRKPRMSDVRDVHEIVNDINIAKNLTTMPHPYSINECKKYYKRKIKEWGKKDYLFAIELKSIKRVIGFMDIGNINDLSKTSWTGSWIGVKYHRNGYITEAKIAANNFAFGKLKLRKLISPVFSENKVSNFVQKKMGYKLEGTLIKNEKCLATGKIHDVNIYGLLKEDWKKVRPKIIKHLNEKIKKLENKK